MGALKETQRGAPRRDCKVSTPGGKPAAKVESWWRDCKVSAQPTPIFPHNRQCLLNPPLGVMPGGKAGLGGRLAASLHLLAALAGKQHPSVIWERTRSEEPTCWPGDQLLTSLLAHSRPPPPLCIHAAAARAQQATIVVQPVVGTPELAPPTTASSMLPPPPPPPYTPALPAAPAPPLSSPALTADAQPAPMPSPAACTCTDTVPAGAPSCQAVVRRVRRQSRLAA